MTSASEDFLGSFTTEFDHGLLAIEDVGSAAVHDDWDPVSEYVHLDQDSLYVGVRTVVDGPVSVAVHRGPGRRVDEAPMEAFAGEMRMGSGQLHVSDSDMKVVLSLTGAPGAWGVAVFVDDLDAASQVAVFVDSHVSAGRARG